MIVTDIKTLREVSINIDDPNDIDIIVKELEEELSKHKTGVGLSAIQIGIGKRVGIIKVLGKEKIVLYNTKILEKSDLLKFNESCLSLPGLSVLTRRYNDITIENGDGQKYGVYGLEAICVQHEIDHWNGKLMIDRKWKKRR